MVKPVNRTLEIAAIGKDASGIGHAAGPVVTYRGKGDPLRSLLVGIDPVQDLHGYDNPWPAGGGKNKCNYLNSNDIFIAEDGTSRVKTSSLGMVSISGDTVTLTRSSLLAGLSIVFRNLLANTQYFFSSITDDDNQYYFGKITWIDDTSYTSSRIENEVETFTTTDAGDYEILIWRTGRDAINIKNAQLEIGSTATPYAPYSNICPISGWSAVNVWRTGKNLLPNKTGVRSTASIYIGQEDGTTYPIHLFAGKTYFLSYEADGTGQIAYFKPSDGSIGVFNSPYTASRDMDVQFWIYATGITSVTDFQLELGSTATAYEPYSGTQYTFQLGQTVYGGTLDVKTGVLTVDRAMVDLGSLTWGLDTGQTHRFIAYNQVTAKPTGSYFVAVNAICSTYKTLTQNRLFQNNIGFTIQATNGNSAYVYDDTYDNADSFQTAMSGVQLVYELAIPITIQLTPQEISTLQGTNNLWADTGDVDVEYSAIGGPGAKLAILLRDRKEMLIALKMGMTQAEAGLLGSLSGVSFGGGLSPGIIRPGASAQDEDEEEEIL